MRAKGQAVAIVSPAEPPKGHPLGDCIARLPEDSTAIMNTDFAKDVDTAIESHQEPFDPPEWE
jgi:hypothetical protein